MTGFGNTLKTGSSHHGRGRNTIDITSAVKTENTAERSVLLECKA